jgi:hypothetical protein
VRTEKSISVAIRAALWYTEALACPYRFLSALSAAIDPYRPYRHYRHLSAISARSAPISSIGPIGPVVPHTPTRIPSLPFPYVLPPFPSASQDFRHCIISLRLHYCVELAAPAGFAKPPSQHHGRSRDDKVCYRATRRCHGFQSRCPSWSSLSNWFDRPSVCHESWNFAHGTCAMGNPCGFQQ